MTLTLANLDYAQVAAKLSASLGRKWGVRILFGGHPATDGRTITLPHWPMDDPLMRGALYGIIAHEAGGHVRRTDFPKLAVHIDTISWPVTIWKSFENILEDIRIEANLMRDYPGVRLYLDMAVQVMLKPDEPLSGQPVEYWPTMFNWCLLVFRHDVLGQRELAPKRDAIDALAERLVGRSVLDEAHAIGMAAGALPGERADFRDLLALADRLTRLFIEADIPDTMPPEPDPSPADAGDDTSPENGEGADPAPSSSDGDGADAADGASSSPSSTDPDDPAQDGAGETGADPSSEATSAAGPQAGDPETGARVDKTVPSEACGDLFEEVCEVLDGTQHTAVPVLGASDTATGPVVTVDVTQTLRKAAALSQRLVPALSPLIVGESWDEIGSRIGRKFDADRLTRVKTDADPSVFRKRVVEDDQSVAFHVLVDRSGSTRNCIDKIREATLALVSSLEAFAQVATAISHFPASDAGDARTATYLTKPFVQPLRQTLDKWPQVDGGTPLAGALQETAFSFGVVEQSRRIVVVVTDGKPDDAASVREVRKTCRGLGVEVIGLVVGCEGYPHDLFDDSTAIEDVAELAPALHALVLRNI